MSDGKLWWKKKTYKAFAKNSCGISNKEYNTIIDRCVSAVQKTKREIDNYICVNDEIKKNLQNLKANWIEKI